MSLVATVPFGFNLFSIFLNLFLAISILAAIISGGSGIDGKTASKLASSATPTCAPLSALIIDFLKSSISVFKSAASLLNPKKACAFAYST